MSRYVARLMAPLAIAVVAVGIYLVVHGNLVTHHSTPTHSAGSSHRHRHGHHHHPRHPKPKYYTVKSGDTLSSIASHTGVSMERLQRLNHSLHPPYSLQAGERLRLRR
ncbi:MAG TPA: LysM domain-containing protein [Solirubrobacteraceae bacterium]|nr:LysM domain-containing protein [Solirubrobacteraceae bacterium]